MDVVGVIAAYLPVVRVCTALYREAQKSVMIVPRPVSNWTPPEYNSETLPNNPA